VGRQRQPLHPKLLYEWAVFCTFHCAVVVPEEEPDPVMQKERLDASVYRLSCSLPLLENHVRMKTAFISNRRRHVRTCKSSRPDLESKRYNALIVLLCNKKVGYISPSIAMARQYTKISPEKKTMNRNAFSLSSMASYARPEHRNKSSHFPIRASAVRSTPSSTQLFIPSEQTRPSTLNSLHLRITVHRPPEPNRQLIAVPELALFRLHAAQLPRSAAANSAQRLGN
jgi:hypothetical protein